MSKIRRLKQGVSEKTVILYLEKFEKLRYQEREIIIGILKMLVNPKFIVENKNGLV